MDIRRVTETYHVSPQIALEDVAELKAAGYAAIICNRPDAEIPPEVQSDAMAQAAQDAGIAFEVHPITHQSMTAEAVAHQRALAEKAGGPVLAYCASGTRCTVIWALAEAQTGRDPEDILRAAAEAGYDLSGLRPTLEGLAKGG